MKAKFESTSIIKKIKRNSYYKSDLNKATQSKSKRKDTIMMDEKNQLQEIAFGAFLRLPRGSLENKIYTLKVTKEILISYLNEMS